MKCPLCDSSDYQLQAKDYQGFVENTFFDLHLCNNCLTSFVDSSKVETAIYEKIYGNKGEGGYQRYYDYATKVKLATDKLQFLAHEETTYLPLYDYLSKQKTKLDILEVGCGFGYTTFAVSELGHNIAGIDVASSAIDFATKEFGNFYKHQDVKDLDEDKKYDLIYAHEVIEHLSDTQGFINNLKRVLKPNGVIHLTTPNKDYATKTNPSAIWLTVLPPHHIFWGTTKGLERMAKLHSLNISFFDFENHYGRQENRLNEVRRLKNPNLPAPVIVNNTETEVPLPMHKQFVLRLLYLPIIQQLTTRYLTEFLNFRDYKTNAIFLMNEDESK